MLQQKLKLSNDINREKVLEQTREEVLDLLKKTIRPEFLNRIDEVIMFSPLTKRKSAEIVRLQLTQLMRK